MFKVGCIRYLKKLIEIFSLGLAKISVYREIR